MTLPLQRQIERYSRAVTLTVLELDRDRHLLVPAFVLANMMSPVLWQWRRERRAFTPEGQLLGVKRRVRELERHFRRYVFTHLEDQPGGDPWGLLSFAEEAERLGEEFIRQARQEYDQSLRMLLADNPESQFGQILNTDYYRRGYFPRLRNEIVEVMEAYRRILPESKGSGKCFALAALWVAALVVWARFSPRNVALIGNRAHAFAFLAEQEGFLLNNTKQFTYRRIHNCSELSTFVKMVTTNTPTTFFYLPGVGFCHCMWRRSSAPISEIQQLYHHIRQFLGIPLQHPEPRQLKYTPFIPVIPDPLDYETAEQYQQEIFRRAAARPRSIFDYARYAFRAIKVPYPQVYLRAALRDYHTRQRARRIQHLREALAVLEQIQEKESIVQSRNRIALPDEVLIFGTGDDRDRAVLLWTLLYHSQVAEPSLAIALSERQSYVRFGHQWIDVDSFRSYRLLPEDPIVMFDHITAVWRRD